MDTEKDYLGLLEAVSYIPKEHKAGFIGWTLYKQALNDDTIIILLQGNDLIKRGVCFFEGPGLWSPGRYALYVQRFDDQNLVPIRSSHRKWTLLESQRRLACGGLRDPLPPLRL